jgi:hypothetical protein
MINSLTGGLEFPEKKFLQENNESDIEQLSQMDINVNYNPVPSV